MACVLLLLRYTVLSWLASGQFASDGSAASALSKLLTSFAKSKATALLLSMRSPDTAL